MRGKYLTLIIKALCMMDKGNYTLPKDDSGKERFQERSIAYEFYYQLRKLLESEIREDKIAFHGEPNKGYQTDYHKKVRKMPDFLIHIPNKDKNYVVIELKMAKRNIKDILKDVQKLINFKKELGYEFLVLLLFGKRRALKNKLEKILEKEESKEIHILAYNLETQSFEHYHKGKLLRKYDKQKCEKIISGA